MDVRIHACVFVYGCLCVFVYSRKYVCCIYYGNKTASSSVSDTGRYITLTNLLDSIFITLAVFIRLWEIQTYLHKASFLKVRRISFVMWMDTAHVYVGVFYMYTDIHMKVKLLLCLII
jgi:hypothetical protein